MGLRALSSELFPMLLLAVRVDTGRPNLSCKWTPAPGPPVSNLLAGCPMSSYRQLPPACQDAAS